MYIAGELTGVNDAKNLQRMWRRSVDAQRSEMTKYYFKRMTAHSLIVIRANISPMDPQRAVWDRVLIRKLDTLAGITAAMRFT